MTAFEEMQEVGARIVNDLAQDVYTVTHVDCTHYHGVVEVVVKGRSLVSKFEIKRVMKASEFARLLEGE